MTRDQLIANLKEIRKYIDLDVSECDIQSSIEKLHKLSCLIGLSASCKAAAKRLLNKKKADLMFKHKDSKMSPSLLIKMIDSECYEEDSLFVYADRINAGITHSIDALRSAISLEKVQIENGLI